MESWTSLAYQFGPFMFALLFCLVITRWGYKIYRRANVRTDPPASEEEKETYRYYFIGTASFGILLVIVSVVWWVTHQPSVHVFQGEITGLREYEYIASTELYMRRENTLLPAESPENNLTISNEHFVFVQDKPIAQNQVFTIYYGKQDGSVKSFKIKYAKGVEAKYEIIWDDDAGEYVLKKVELLPEPGISFLFNTAYAQELRPRQKTEYQFQQMIREEAILDSSTNNLVRLLQDERTEVGRKIEALDVVAGLEDGRFSEFMETSSDKEPVVLTLLDLTRHTDRELAYKARKILYDRFNLDRYFSRKLRSNNSVTLRTAESILLRMKPERAAKILEAVSEQGENPQINQLKRTISSGDKARVLIPSGSAQGDRYYVKASWDPQNKDVTSCLTELFNRELISKRNLEEEKEMMAGKSSRLVYRYSKEWALRMASAIENCGGKAEFVGF